jgi:iron complex outermembrane recepter protein
VPKHLNLISREAAILLAVAAFSAPATSIAQNAANDEATDNAREIVVTAERISGSVITDIPPIDVINEDDIASFGASSITDLLASISPQTSSGRGRGGGMPIILINGQRISGFRELRNIPPEAIRQVQVFPEEVALQYGYRPDQRVINFVLKKNFAAVNVEAERGAPEAGGYVASNHEVKLTNFGDTTRLNLNAEYSHSGRLTEKDRNIIPEVGNLSNASTVDITQFRTLIPLQDKFEVEMVWSKAFSPITNLSLNANYLLEAKETLLGLPNANLILPGTSPFSPTGVDSQIGRYFMSPGPLGRDTQSHSANFGLTFNSRLAGLQWTVTSDYAHIKEESITTRNADFTALQTGLTAGTTDPFAANFGSDLLFVSPDTANSLNTKLELANVLAGRIFELPSGPVQFTFRTGFSKQSLDSDSARSGIFNSAALRRNNMSGSLNIEIPIVGRDIGPLGFLGEVSVNGNYGLSQLSDFGQLTEYTAGIRWSPTKDVSFQVSVIGDENAPDISQLGNPVQSTPNVSVYDFSQNTAALVNIITGGNPALIGEKRRDLKLSASWSPAKVKNLNLQIEYFRNRSSNTSVNFPLLTSEIEAAFPGRVTRDSSGALISVDRRPVNYAEERSQSIRSGFTLSGEVGKATARPDRANGPSLMGRPGSDRSAGRWEISLYHSYQIQDDILIAPGIPRLDLLHGSATSELGGTPRHKVELSGGFYYKGLGSRLSGNYRSPTRANGSGLPGSSDLRFSDLATLNLRFFVMLDEQGNLTKKIPFLKGSRIRLNIDNVLDDIVDVRDQNGMVPLSYQPGYLDPKGRYFEISFRKQF